MPEIEIPLERIDLISLPEDPRSKLPDYCYTSEDGDSFPWTLPIPRFWREVIRQVEQRFNQERTLNGQPKLSTSLIRQRVLQQTQRVGMAAQRRVDPRLERSLFTNAPRKVPSSSKLHNQSVPGLKTSIFDVENAEDVSSDSSSSLSFSSSANESGPSKKRTRQNNNLFDDLSDDDDDLSFSTFNKRRLTDDRTNSKKKNVSPIKNDLKNVLGNKSDTIHGNSKIIEYFQLNFHFNRDTN